MARSEQTSSEMPTDFMIAGLREVAQAESRGAEKRPEFSGISPQFYLSTRGATRQIWHFRSHRFAAALSGCDGRRLVYWGTCGVQQHSMKEYSCTCGSLPTSSPTFCYQDLTSGTIEKLDLVFLLFSIPPIQIQIHRVSSKHEPPWLWSLTLIPP